MTREEAIANLNMISVAFVDPVTKEQRELIDETFDMAIKALEQEPYCDLLVIRINAILSAEYEKKFRDNIIKQKEMGVVILPYFAEPIITPKDIEIKINDEESEV